MVETVTVPIRALGLGGPMKHSSPPIAFCLEEGPLIARWRAANEPTDDLGDSSDGTKGLP